MAWHREDAPVWDVSAGDGAGTNLVGPVIRSKIKSQRRVKLKKKKAVARAAEINQQKRLACLKRNDPLKNNHAKGTSGVLTNGVRKDGDFIGSKVLLIIGGTSLAKGK